MGDVSKIQWTTHTWNPWQGCTKVSPACANCYMYREKNRYRQDPTTVIRSKRPTFNKPLARLQDRSWRWPDGGKVFTCSWSDWCHEDADKWRDDAWALIRQRPGLIFQILTKRADRIKECLPADWGEGYPNVWLGVTAEDQQRADERIPVLLTVPAAVRFVSIEPLLGRIDLTDVRYQDMISIDALAGRCGVTLREQSCEKLDWVIVGGESGPNSRRTDPTWIEKIRRDCWLEGVPFFMKQTGVVLARELGDSTPGGSDMSTWMSEWRVRQFPTVSS